MTKKRQTPEPKPIVRETWRDLRDEVDVFFKTMCATCPTPCPEKKQIDALFQNCYAGKHLPKLDRRLEALFDRQRTIEGVDAAVDRADYLVTKYQNRWEHPSIPSTPFRERYHEWALRLARRAKARIAEKAADRLEQTDKQTEILSQRSTSIKDRFKFHPGQVLFDDNDLGLPPGLPVDVLRRLCESFGLVVLYSTLDENMSSAKEASESLRKAKQVIQASLKKHAVPCEIVRKTRSGYLIREQTLPHSPA